MPLPRVEDSSDFLCPDPVNTIFVEISRTCRWFDYMFITRVARLRQQTKRNVRQENCAENLGHWNIRAKSKFSTKVAEPHQKPTELQRRWTAVLVTQQARQRKPQPPVDRWAHATPENITDFAEGRFWTTSRKTQKRPRNERNKDEREIGPFNQSVDQLAISGKVNKPTMENAISGCKQNEIIQPCHLERTRSAALHYKKVHGGSETQKRTKGGP